MERADLERWIRAYEAAWRASGTAAADDLFADDATYLTHPFADPVAGREAIRALWEREREPGERFTMTGEVVAIDADTGVARIDVRYDAPEQARFRDLWIVRLGPDGRCRHFEEWPFAPRRSVG
ncbi:MAG TPA: nuclear transport factor 2 family protein [Miltoncostaea sp.]|nr:nuclear transport factor 2 family protein [Miltoncostaea sp.]